MDVETWWAANAAIAAVASAAIALVAMAVSWWLLWWNRPQVEWGASKDSIAMTEFQEIDLANVIGLPGPTRLYLRLTNVGDGSAFDVKVTGYGCFTALFELNEADTRGFSAAPVVASVTTGSYLHVAVWTPPEGMPAEDREGVCIEWTQAPTRWKRRLHQDLVLRSDQYGDGQRRSIHRKRTRTHQNDEFPKGRVRRP